MISTVDPEARHGHKTSARGYDGFKGHIAIDPDSEIITNHAVTAANVADGSVARALLEDVLPAVPSETETPAAPRADQPESATDSANTGASMSRSGTPSGPVMNGQAEQPVETSRATDIAEPSADSVAPSTSAIADAATTSAEVPAETSSAAATASTRVEVCDASHGTGELLEYLEGRAIPHVKVQAPSAPAGHFSCAGSA